MTDDNRPNPSTTSTLTWLHLSDFHFKAEYDERGKLKTNWQRDKVLEDLMRDVIVKLPEQGLAPDLVFITGDIAHSGKPDEYDVARIFFDNLAEELKHHPEKQWFIVPGNHDVDRKKVDIADMGLRNHLTEALSKAIMDSGALRRHAARQQAFLDFTKHFLGSKRPWQAETPWQVFDFEKGGLKLAVLQLNSAWAAQDDEDEGKLLIGEYQLREALKTANAMNPHLKIALFHHPEEVLRDFDQSALEGYLCQSDGCQFLLRGHMHKTKLKMGKTPNGESFSLAAGACWQDSKFAHSVMVVQLDLAAKKGTAHVWTYTPNDGGHWGRDTLLYRKMENGQWPFDLPNSWNLPQLVNNPHGKPDAKPGETWTGAFVPARYSQYLEDELGQIESLATSKEKPVLMRLKQVYVPIKTSWTEPEKRKTMRIEMEQAGSKAEKIEKKEPSEVAHTTRPLSELLKLEHPRHFLVSGKPGCGKSTFVKFSALDALATESEKLPLLLELKAFGAWLKDRPKSGEKGDLLVTWAGEVLEEWGLNESALKPRLGQGRILWLLDGLDEIFDKPTRLRAARIIGKWPTDPSGKADQIILTTRDHALRQKGIKKALHLEEAAISAMDPADQKVFLTHWFDALFGTEGSAKAKRMREDLWSALAHQKVVQNLRDNPLMLSVLGTIYYFGKRLPERRSDLYREAIDALLQRRFGEDSGGNEYLVRRMWSGLGEVALGMMALGAVRDITEEGFLKLLEKGFHEGRVATREEREELIGLAESLISSSGLLKSEGLPAKYEFIHFGFQEYLAARAIGDKSGAYESVKPHLEDGVWRETILLTAGYLMELRVGQLGEAFIESLMKAAESKEKCNRVELAIMAALEAPPGNLPPELANRLRTRAVVILGDATLDSPEKDRFNLGMALGRLGDPRLGMEQKDRWVWIEPGSFDMGREDGYEPEKPVHRVEITQGYWLGKYPVTNEEYQKFVDGKGYETEGWWSKAGLQFLHKQKVGGPQKYSGFGGANQPVVGVCWYEAEAYCRWLSGQFKNESRKPAWVPDGYRVVLPTEAQWEYVARGETGWPYPWGKEAPNEQRANYDQRLKQTSPVGIYPLGATPQGVLDLSGNVWEWCLDPWDAHAYKKRKAGEKDPVAVGDKSEGEDIRVVRGGSWVSVAGGLAGAFRDWSWAGNRNDNIGFRCCLSRCP